MYLEYYGLDAPPFRITPDTRAFYTGADRGAVLSALHWAVLQGEGIVKVVGEVGSGKTMLCRMLAGELPEHVAVAYLSHPGLSAPEIAPALARELGLEAAASDRLGAVHALQSHLVAQHAAGRQVVALIEEAQNMPAESLEELRLLSNLETDDSKLLQLVLFGQPELDTTLARPEIRQLRERISHAFELGPLGPADAASYLNFRMRAAGYRGPDLFSRALGQRLNRHADGLIRRLNLLADKTLLAAYAEGSKTVRARHVRRAARDRQPAHSAQQGWRRWLGRFRAAAILLAAALLGPGSSAAYHEDVAWFDAGAAEVVRHGVA